ncbi:MAG: hypothetical protein PHI12_11935 [Dehalococcoidales bacterium]|nr:hypothetical protein [Dehalococcoidales bacterium]
MPRKHKHRIRSKTTKQDFYSRRDGVDYIPGNWLKRLKYLAWRDRTKRYWREVEEEIVVQKDT